MNASILNRDIQDFICENLHTDIATLLLKGTSFGNVDTKEIIEQIEAKKRCKTKLPKWFQADNIYYPNKLNIEQTSSEVTAKYKSELISGDSIIDLTGGFGVDCFYFSKHFKEVVHCEINVELSEIVHHNYKELGVSNIENQAIDGVNFLKSSDKKFDWIYIDPSRRHESKGKVFFLKDCLPNVPEHLDLLFNASKNILIKTSPLLDISIGINELQSVKAIYVVAVNNEVKELLWVLENGFEGNIQMETVNIKNDALEKFKFILNDNNPESEYSEPLSYLYEPNSAILKSGGFNEITSKFNVSKLHQHSHLYTSFNKIDFPGRSFKIGKIINYNKKEFKKLNINKANVTTRNFPETVQQIRKKLNLKDGGDIYLFFTTNLNNKKIVVICKKV